ncbi:hypothetical protein Cgig2_023140 [Carnegiea gigantea]|uniref:Uncharacterized protein n=1 Tax=Carnegiea gigantea TaxID=171969 RepID=A0A9Q1GJ21_9CARY|nr:hypothetical protein Cgig2_023140 [Carnegiea gigantea]
MHAVWLKEWKIEQNASKLARMLKFILAKKDVGESFRRNFIIYLVNCLFSGPKNRYCNKSILKYVKDVSQITSLDWCQFVLGEADHQCQPKHKANNDNGAPSFSPALPLHKPDSEAQISETTLVTDADVIVEKEDQCEDVVLDQPNNVMKKDDSIPSYSLGWELSQPDSKSPVPHTTSVPDPDTATEKDDSNENDDDSAPLGFQLRNTS